jgi:hypothetical protein
MGTDMADRIGQANEHSKQARQAAPAAALLAAVLLLGGCGQSAVRPDLARLYRGADNSAQVPPLVVVHGVLGSRLETAAGREVWPGGVGKLLWSDYQDLALEVDPKTLDPANDGVHAVGIFDAAAGQDFYGAILRTLEQSGGYLPTVAGTPVAGPGRRYYLFIYDWRQDNVASARALDALIERIRTDYGDPALKVDLLAHSNGGLIARYFARYGGVDVLDDNRFDMSQAGAAKIRRMLLLGTPNFGSMAALSSLIEGRRLVFGRIAPEVFLTMPSAYQLLPHALNDWLVTPTGEPLERDLFDVEVWRRFGWSVFDPAVRARIAAAEPDAAAAARRLELLEHYFERRLDRARRFTWSLTVAERGTGVRPIVFGGDCTLTPARALVEEADGDSVLRLYPEQVRDRRPGVDYNALMLEPGDGTVTKASLLARQTLDPGVPRHPWSFFPIDYPVFLCAAHDRLTGNPNFQDNLLHALLSVDR